MTASIRHALGTRLVVGLALIGFTATGCRGGELATGVSDSTYVRVMAGLRRLPVGPVIDTQARNRARDSILRAHGITATQLESAAVALSDDPVRASELWRAIERRVTPPR
jgi:hypothetical protein